MSKEKRDDAAYSQTTAPDPCPLDPPILEEVTHLLYHCTVDTIKK